MILTIEPSRAETPERLVAGGFVRQANRDASLFFVRSITNFHHDYVCRVVDGEVECDCDDDLHRGDCSHAIAVRAVLQRASRP